MSIKRRIKSAWEGAVVGGALVIAGVIVLGVGLAFLAAIGLALRVVLRFAGVVQ